ncbi:helix-turn-helix domain-containing protein, partial [Xenorhabdus cabanillasii]
MTLSSQDWHRADIRAALEKRGTNLRTLSVAAGGGG